MKQAAQAFAPLRAERRRVARGVPIDAAGGAPVAALVAAVVGHFDRDLRERVLALWGLTLTPACGRGIAVLAQHGARLVAYDPLLARHAGSKRLAGPSLSFAANRMSAVNGADALLILNGWGEFRSVDASELRERMRVPLVFDGHHLYDAEALAGQGVEYHAVGALAGCLSEGVGGIKASGVGVDRTVA